jgi:hypothetical protein
MTVSADTGGTTLPVILSLCETIRARAQCVNSPVPPTIRMATNIAANATPADTPPSPERHGVVVAVGDAGIPAVDCFPIRVPRVPPPPLDHAPVATQDGSGSAGETATRIDMIPRVP